MSCPRADITETMSDNKEQSVAALNTLINLALQVDNTQQAQVQNAAKVLAQALELGPADDAEKEEDEGPTIVTTDWRLLNQLDADVDPQNGTSDYRTKIIFRKKLRGYVV